MSTFEVTLYLGVEQREGPDHGTELILDMDELPGGHPPAVGQEIEFNPGERNPMQAVIDTCSEPDADGVIKVTCFRWATGNDAYFYWRDVLDQRYNLVSWREVHEDMVHPNSRAQLAERQANLATSESAG